MLDRRTACRRTLSRIRQLRLRRRHSSLLCILRRLCWLNLLRSTSSHWLRALPRKAWPQCLQPRVCFEPLASCRQACLTSTKLTATKAASSSAGKATGSSSATTAAAPRSAGGSRTKLKAASRPHSRGLLVNKACACCTSGLRSMTHCLSECSIQLRVHGARSNTAGLDEPVSASDCYGCTSTRPLKAVVSRARHTANAMHAGHDSAFWSVRRCAVICPLTALQQLISERCSCCTHKVSLAGPLSARRTHSCQKQRTDQGLGISAIRRPA